MKMSQNSFHKALATSIGVFAIFGSLGNYVNKPYGTIVGMVIAVVLIVWIFRYHKKLENNLDSNLQND